MASSTLSRIGSTITSLRVFTLNTLFLLVLLLVVVTLLRGCGGATLAERQALLIAPSGLLVDRLSPSPPLPQLIAGGVAREIVITDLVRAIDAAADDERIPVLVLQLEDLPYVSQAHSDTLGAAIRRFQAAGKRVIAYGTSYSQGQYLLASHADEVYLHPFGQALLTGYGTYPLYFKDLLDKLNINVHVFRAGEFKSAVEPFTAAGMSEPAKLADRELLESLWSRYAEVAASNRQMASDAFKGFVDALPQQVVAASGDMALALVEGHLVDELLTLDALNARLADAVGQDEDGNYRAVTAEEYLAHLGPTLPRPGASIGLIVASGPIFLDGDEASVASAVALREHIRDARLDDDVRAIVLRVDSPGGSAFASEIIRQELELAQLAGKPVVASMGDVAASGGYWIAATADQIFAHPGTITGSIGVFSLIPTFEDALASVGIGRDGVGTSPLSGSLSLTGGLSDPMKSLLQASVDHTYDRFTHLVARGRDLPLAKVQEIAQGRVWAGSAAQSIGLVDTLGDLQAAIDAAAELAGLETWQVQRFETPQDPTAQLISNMLQSRTPVSTVGHALSLLEQAEVALQALDDPKRVYALCESCSVTLRQ